MSTLAIQYSYEDGSANTIRRTGITYPDGTQLVYDYGDSGSDDDLLSRVSGLTWNSTAVGQYTYLGLATPVQTIYPQPAAQWNLATGSGADPYAGLDLFGRTIDCRWQTTGGSPVDLARLEYGYDQASNRLWRQDDVARGLSAHFDELYEYDTADRLIDLQRGTLNSGHTAISDEQLEQTWELDPTGNWNEFTEDLPGTINDLDQTRTHNEANEITEIDETTGAEWTTPAYDRAGNTVSFPQPLALTDSYSATYDAWNRLVQLKSGDSTAARYSYDGLNRRTQNNDELAWESFTLDQWAGFTLEQWDTFVLENTGQRHFYYSDQWQVLEERAAGATTADRQFVWGLRYVDDLILRDRDTDGDGDLDERLYALQDANWNVAATIDISAAVQQRFAYTAYGVPAFLNDDFSAGTNAADWETLFTGQRYDAETGLYLYRNRFYHPRLGVFATRDPTDYKGRDLNLYRYTINRPIHLIDSTGHQCIKPNSIGQFISGRGAFIGCNMGERDTQGDWVTRIGSFAGIKFSWAGVKWPGSQACCCTEVGFLQVVLNWKTIWTTGISGSNTPVIDGGIPYPLGAKGGQPTANPCTSRTSAIAIEDGPSAPAPFYYGTLLSHEQTFQTCAVCLNGCEGPVLKNAAGIIGGSIVTGRLYSAMAVYGCISWGHNIVRLDSGSYSYTRWMGNQSISGGTSASLMVNRYGGDPPLPGWIQAVSHLGFSVGVI